MDKHGRIEDTEDTVAEENAGPNAEWREYERALAEHEARRRQMAAMGLTMRQAAPQPPSEGQNQMTDEKRAFWSRMPVGKPKPGTKLVPLAPPNPDLR